VGFLLRRKFGSLPALTRSKKERGMIALPEHRVEELDHGFLRELVLPNGFEVVDGRLFDRGLDVLAEAQRPLVAQGQLQKPTLPLYMRRLSVLRHNYEQLNRWFADAKQECGYPADLMVAFASKANPSEPVVRTLISTGAAYECSSAADVSVVRHAYANGWLDENRPILINGFKIPVYAEAVIELRADGFKNILPIFDDLEEIGPFAESGYTFEVGLRFRTDSEKVNRFGLSHADLYAAADRIAEAGNLRLTTFHAMQTVSASQGLAYQTAMIHSLRAYAALKRQVPSLHRFNFGGGLPGVPSGMDFETWMLRTLQTIMAVCDEEGIPVPDLIIESGRYLVQDHASKLFRVVKVRTGDDGIPFYMIEGSIMSNFPDAWALGDEFNVLPVNNWDGPWQRVRLAGLTCDHDDVYPTRKMEQQWVMLPVNTDGLVIGFFECGAYQETLGGRGGAKHCMLPEHSEMILDGEAVDGETEVCIEYTPGQSFSQVMGNLGYKFDGAKPHTAKKSNYG
jgi:arginine decarboxylase